MISDFKRVLLYGFLLLTVYMLWTAWQKEHPAQITPKTVVTGDSLLPTAPLNANSPQAEASMQSQMQSQEDKHARVYVKTDVLNVAIDLQNGDFVDAQLLKYPESLEDKAKPVALLNDAPESAYTAGVRLLTLDAGALKNMDVSFSSQKSNYVLTGDRLQVKLYGKTKSGLEIEKRLTFRKGEYLVDVSYWVKNTRSTAASLYFSTQILRADPHEDKSSLFHVGSYVGASVSLPGEKMYKKLSFSDLAKNDFKQTVQGGWVAMQQHYFLTAWVPNQDASNEIYSRALGSQYVIGMISNPKPVPQGALIQWNTRIYLGPELTDVLQNIAPGLALTVDYGWLSAVSQFLFWVMKHIYQYVGNWGWVIVIVTLLIKLAFYRLSATSYRSMANMRNLQPKLQALKERFGDDKAKFSQAMMELYRKEKVNPLGGCLPIVIQIPVFIALYWVLLESVQLRQAPFVLWIHDLSSSDPYYILPIMMGLTMFVQQKLSPTPPDPTQAKIMMFLPAVFTFLFLHFPAGLVLYWTVNNGLSILQQWYITKKIATKPLRLAKK